MARGDTKTSKPAKPEFGEIAFTTGGRDITRGFVQTELLRPSDKILTARGAGNYAVYQEVLRDDQVVSTFQQRRGAVVSREIVVEAGGRAAIDVAAADALRDNLDAINFDQITDRMLYGIFFGFAVGECIWALDGNRVVIEDVKVRNRQRFRWDAEGGLRLITLKEPLGLRMPERKFWTFSTGADHDDEPYGLGLAHWLYWPVFFKRHGIRFWLIFLEKFGTPTVIGKFSPSASDDDREKLLAAVNAIQTDAGVIIPEGMLIELLEAKRSGSADQAAFYAKMDAAIAKVVLSQTMTTEDGSSKSQAEVHFDVRQEVVKSDADLVMGSFNCGPARWLTAWNFPGAKPPKVRRRTEDDPELLPVAERDAMIAGMGFDPTQEYIDETYGKGFVKVAPETPRRPVRRTTSAGGPKPGSGGEPKPAFGEPGVQNVCPGCGAAAFAETDAVDDSIERLTEQVLDEEWERLVDPLVGQVRALAAEAETVEGLRDRLAEALQGPAIGAFAERLAQAVFQARLAGETGADISDQQTET